MDRMAKNTKQADVLRELFAAIGNDPSVIAECLARPALAERLVTNWYAYDQRIHGELKQRAGNELQAHDAVEQMKQTSGTYREIELIRSDSVGEPEDHASGRCMKLGSRKWAETLQMVAATLNIRGTASESYKTIPVGKLSPLQEDKSRYYTTAVVNKTKDRLKLAAVSWLKESFESWRARTENQMRSVMAAPSGNYTLPKVLGGTGGCTDDTWTATSGPPDGRVGHTAVWTGSEMIIWGGYKPSSGFDVNTGGKYNPATDTWTATSTTNAPIVRDAHTAVWTGSEMIVWGGYNGSDLNTGGRYNPGTDSWLDTGTTNAPVARDSHTAIWTGSEMIVWGGFGDSGELNTGGRYNPATNSWTVTSTSDAPTPRLYHTAIWTGSEMIVWGGFDGSNDLNSGGKYNPSTNSWRATSTINAPAARASHTAVWTGIEMIVWGGGNDNGYLNTGGRYNPVQIVGRPRAPATLRLVDTRIRRCGPAVK